MYTNKPIEFINVIIHYFSLGSREISCQLELSISIFLKTVHLIHSDSHSPFLAAWPFSVHYFFEPSGLAAADVNSMCACVIDRMTK